MSNRFYASSIEGEGIHEIRGPEAHHLSVVSRIPKGSRIVLFSGNGWEYEAEVLEIRKNHVVLDILKADRVDRESGVQVTVYCSLPKSDRADFLIEKLVEIGVKKLVPLECERTQYRSRELNLEKMIRHIIEASKQCGRNCLMEMEGSISLESALSRSCEIGTQSLIAHPGSQAQKVMEVPRVGKYNILIGPEGGFTDSEFASASNAGWLPVDLGPRILRVETAALLISGALIQRG